MAHAGGTGLREDAPMPMPVLPTIVLIALPAATAAAAATPQSAPEVNRCIRDDGAPVYTDKSCAAIDARPGGDAVAPGPFVAAYRNACIPSLRDFAYELSSAIEVRDVNRLAALYDWKGLSTREGYAAMDRLQGIVARPLLRLEAVHAPAPPPPVDAPMGDEAAAAAQAPAPSSYLPTSPQGPPIAIRLHQTLADGVTPSTTTLPLRRESGCWWVGP